MFLFCPAFQAVINTPYPFSTMKQSCNIFLCVTLLLLLTISCSQSNNTQVKRDSDLTELLQKVYPLLHNSDSVYVLFSVIWDYDILPLTDNEQRLFFLLLHALSGDMDRFTAAITVTEVLRDMMLLTNQSLQTSYEARVRYQTELKEVRLAYQTKEIQQQARNIRLQLTIIALLTITSFLFVLLVLFQRRKAKNAIRIVQQYEQLLGYRQGEEANRTTKADNVAKKLSNDLMHLFEVEKIYRQQGLSVDDLVEKLSINRRHLLQVFKEYQKNFNDFVNTYRVAEARELLKDDKYNKYTIQAISEIVGFNSLSVFYTAFKQEVGVAPAEYRKVIRKMKEKTT